MEHKTDRYGVVRSDVIARHRAKYGGKTALRQWRETEVTNDGN